jgi:hypothetical protein
LVFMLIMSHSMYRQKVKRNLLNTECRVVRFVKTVLMSHSRYIEYDWSVHNISESQKHH